MSFKREFSPAESITLGTLHSYFMYVSNFENPNLERLKARLAKEARSNAEKIGADIKEVARMLNDHAQFILNLAEELEAKT
jgi:uncharacterized protein YozE (UPF0346 family)